ncbi:MAG: hypothetical protein JSR97_09680 [Verrucomicrobia bacterium]|nr:hypothetical protein [Verrucomicrobiota bacterium]
MRSITPPTESSSLKSFSENSSPLQDSHAEFHLSQEDSSLSTLENTLVQGFQATGMEPQEAHAATDQFLESVMMMMLRSLQHTMEQAHQSAKQNRSVYGT